MFLCSRIAELSLRALPLDFVTVDFDFFCIRVPIASLTTWAAQFTLGPHCPLKKCEWPPNSTPIAIAPFCLFVPDSCCNQLLDELRTYNSIVVASSNGSSKQHLSVWTEKLIAVLAKVHVPSVWLAGFGQKQPLVDCHYLSAQHLSPFSSAAVYNFSFSCVDEAFAGQNRWDIGITVAVSQVHLPLFSVTQRSASDEQPEPVTILPRSSPIIGLQVETFPMLSEIGNGDGSVRLAARYHRSTVQAHSNVSSS